MTDDDASRARLARDVATYYRRYRTIAACMRRFKLCSDTIKGLLELAGQPLVGAQPVGWPPAELSGFLQDDQLRLGGHDRARAICANMAERGLSVERIVDATGFTRVAVEHHLETARLKHGKGNGRG